MSLLAPERSAPPEAGTATGPTARGVWRQGRGPLLAVGLLVLAAVLVAVLSAGRSGLLDPDGYDPSGAHAAATLLRERGLPVQRVVSVADAVRGAGPGTTVFVPVPGLLGPGEVQQLADLPGELVLVGAGDAQLTALGAGANASSRPAVARRQPACDLPVATRAGDVVLGGVGYLPTGAARSTGCYAVGGRATLLRLPDARLTLVGSGQLFTNDRLAEEGDAALALGLLSTGDEVRWLVPDPNRVPPGADGPAGVGSLVDPGLRRVVVQLFAALAVFALWRARRLGRVVPEPLPVVVHAAETVEGRSRLYRAAGARERAAGELRAGARDRLVRRLGLPPDAAPPSVVAGAAESAGRPAAEVGALLYGAAPVDDAALVRLADDLDTLTREVAGS